ncbi:HTH-type transcriptional regulator KdgR [Collibacillus ludicampi]|uniref:HTH-type transcriptional regulator KdgR n=1 Tax=Collibacillus ludicampi TaxID=2771369 RepID=A0AAV4LCK2_9BACL|nr:LacI family DNA-binding transcriptional regulator [Collibacillus ludicampi]GIM45446.1 HTH-type transcriptional regulator KdgR [Collibacillus ludicampi]
MKQDARKRITIDHVARRAGVSKTTVSRYLNGHYEALAEQTLKRIQEAIIALDYRPNRMASGLKRDRSHLIGIVVADITNPFSTAILRGAEDVCKRHGYSLMVCNTDNDPAKEREYIFMLQAQRIDGLIINTTGQNNEFLHQLAAEHTPVVLVDRKVPELGFDTVGVDNEQATAEAVHYLVEQGYERIAFFSEPIDGISSRMERLISFQNVLRRYGHCSVSDIYEIDLRSEKQLEKKLDAFVHSSQDQSRVLFAANGVILLQLILELRKKGLQIPEDISVLGFDDLDWAPVVGPGITTIAQPTYEIGVTAMERVLQRLEGDDTPARQISLSGQLIVRGSTPSSSKPDGNGSSATTKSI